MSDRVFEPIELELLLASATYGAEHIIKIIEAEKGNPNRLFRISHNWDDKSNSFVNRFDEYMKEVNRKGLNGQGQEPQELTFSQISFDDQLTAEIYFQHVGGQIIKSILGHDEDSCNELLHFVDNLLIELMANNYLDPTDATLRAAANAQFALYHAFLFNSGFKNLWQNHREAIITDHIRGCFVLTERLLYDRYVVLPKEEEKKNPTLGKFLNYNGIKKNTLSEGQYIFVSHMIHKRKDDNDQQEHGFNMRNVSSHGKGSRDFHPTHNDYGVAIYVLFSTITDMYTEMKKNH